VQIFFFIYCFAAGIFNQGCSQKNESNPSHVMLELYRRLLDCRTWPLSAVSNIWQHYILPWLPN